MKQGRITVIIVDYNTPERTACYIRELCAASDVQGLSFVIVDNYTAADSEPLFWESFGNHKEIPVHYVHADKNRGFAVGNNLGVSAANEVYDPEFYLFSNSDILLPEKFLLSCLVKVLEENEKVAVVGPRVTGPDGVTLSPSVRVGIAGKHIISNLLWPVNLFIPSIHKLNRNIVDDPVTGQVYYVVGAFMLTRRSCFEAVGGFDEHTFLYAEEGILAERLLKKGFSEYYVDEVSLIHEEGGSTTERDRSVLANLLKKRKRVFDSEMYYYKKYRRTPDLLISTAWFAFFCFCLKLRLYMLLKAVLPGKGESERKS